MYFTQNKSSPIYSLDFNSMKLVAAADQSVGLINYNVNVSVNIQKDYSEIFEFVSHAR